MGHSPLQIKKQTNKPKPNAVGAGRRPRHATQQTTTLKMMEGSDTEASSSSMETTSANGKIVSCCGVSKMTGAGQGGSVFFFSCRISKRCEIEIHIAARNIGVL